MLKRGLILCVACAPLALVFGCLSLFPPACTADTDCTGGGVCVSGACVACAADADCAEGEVCTNNACVAEPECQVDADCAAGEVCTDGACVAEPECQVDADCAAGEVCTDGSCVAGGGGADPVAGEAFFMANGCAGCHAADGTGGIGPNIQDGTAAEVLARLDGTETHPITVPNVTLADAEDVAAWLNGL